MSNSLRHLVWFMQGYYGTNTEDRINHATGLKAFQSHNAATLTDEENRAINDALADLAGQDVGFTKDAEGDE